MAFPIDRSKEALRRKLLNWFEDNGRHWIPWKLKADGTPVQSGEVIHPYPIWIAEVMLQQTQLKTVLPYWEKWMKTFPTLVDLGHADEQEVLLVWEGLGYYSRARRLHQASKKVLDSIGADQSLDPNAWPQDLHSWVALPGIGRSTAGSIISSAFDSPSPILEGNGKRIFSRLMAFEEVPKNNSKILWCLSENLLDQESPRIFNQALMDLGAIICLPRIPKCDVCPWKNYCLAYKRGEPANFPLKEPNKSVPLEIIGIGLIINQFEQVLIDQRLNDGLLGGMWEFPGGKQEKGEDIEITIFRELREELAIEVQVKEQLIVFEHSYSHKKLRFVVHLCKLIKGEPKPLASQQVRWVGIESLDKFPFPSANKRIIDALINYLKADN